MNDFDKIAALYLATWNEADEAQRRLLLNDWAEDARYSDPLMHGEGREGISAMISAARAQFPGLGFKLHGAVDGHGCNIRFSWALSPENGEPVARGTDFVRVDEQGRIAAVTGFLDTGAA
ncbi:MAG: nuclear transport factor 2 family protein [Rhizobiales bacterium]|nr:nuclear transport factor 2 family protein [Hyphomicrobiales bacterium]